MNNRNNTVTHAVHPQAGLLIKEFYMTLWGPYGRSTMSNKLSR